MSKNYNLKNIILLIRDKTSVKYHVSQDDYFGTIATIIALIKQKIEKNPADYTPDFKKTLTNIEKDLVWLQENYQIIPRIKKKKIIPKGREKNQCSNNIKTKRETASAKEKFSRLPSRTRKKKKNMSAKNETKPVSAKNKSKEL